MSAIGYRPWYACACICGVEEVDNGPPPNKTDEQMIDEAVAMLKTGRYFIVPFTTLSEQTLRAEAQVEVVFRKTSFVTKDFLNKNAFIERAAVENPQATAYQIYKNTGGIYFENQKSLSVSVDSLNIRYGDPVDGLRIYVIRHVGENFKPREVFP